MGSKLKLQPGKFYKARNGSIWCCYRINKGASQAGAYADCINTETSTTEYFYADGRYDHNGKRELCLVEEVDPS